MFEKWNNILLGCIIGLESEIREIVMKVVLSGCSVSMFFFLLFLVMF